MCRWARSIIRKDIIDEVPIHNCRSDYGLHARALSIILKDIIDEAPIYNCRSDYGLRIRALSIIPSVPGIMNCEQEPYP
jgi:hypothetical protein